MNFIKKKNVLIIKLKIILVNNVRVVRCYSVKRHP